MIKIAIVGSGPSAFYAAQAFFKADDTIHVDMFEKLPTPFGLLRGGVAPDHQRMKTVSKSYEKIASHSNFRFFGNVEIGVTIDLDTLRSHYHSVIFAIGAETDRKMGIPGEDLPGSHTATEFVAWYNGQPDYQSHTFDLQGSSAIIIGQGNVAVDVARILAKPIEELSQTDITDNAIQQLAKSQIRDIYMIGRRGPAQSAFTELELKELGHIDGVNIRIGDDLFLSDADQQEVETISKARKNVTQLKALASLPESKHPKTLHILFYASPVEVISDHGRVSRVRFENNHLDGDAGHQKAVPSGTFFELDCDLLFRSIGYRGVPFKGLPFDDRQGIIPNVNGQVVDASGHNVPGVYVTGWIKRGPSGVIGTNRSDSIETVQTCLASLDSSLTIDETDIQDILLRNKIRFISYSEWQKIDAYEVSVGQKKGKPREKLTSLDEILHVLSQ
ncbi:MAG: NADP oxidoreductase [Candidatus Marinamargulisbacteria bacterium]